MEYVKDLKQKEILKVLQDIQMDKKDAVFVRYFSNAMISIVLLAIIN
jgi:lauroyl/myristoyl acyltransferase